uniref:Transmembrane protein n=1 Tax=Fagus sylvatica TaxID=28930 RepID=A0A2N9J956_FAGSY
MGASGIGGLEVFYLKVVGFWIVVVVLVVLPAWVWVWVCCLDWRRHRCGSVAGGAAGVGVGVDLLLGLAPAWVWVCCWWCCRLGCVGLMVVLPAWVCGFDGGAAGVGVGLMVVLPAWVWV